MPPTPRPTQKHTQITRGLEKGLLSKEHVRCLSARYDLLNIKGEIVYREGQL